MRPLLKKMKWWEKRSAIKPETKYVVLEKLEYTYTQDRFEPMHVRNIIIGVDDPSINYYPDIKVLMKNLTHEDAVMWANMMR